MSTRPFAPTLGQVRQRGLGFGAPGPALAAGAAAIFAGALCAAMPMMAAGMAALVVVVALVVVAPVAHFALFLAVTAIVPIEIQNQFSIGGGVDSPGLLGADALLLTGLARAVLVLAAGQEHRRERMTLVLAVAVLLLATAQVVNGIAAGVAPSEVGAEFRVILALAGTALMAIPLLRDEGSRRRLFGALLGIGLAVGVWGIMQWALGLRFGDADEALRSASGTFLTAGRTVGQYAFPVAAVMALAVWSSGAARGPLARMLLPTVLVVNLLATFLTFQRTFWVVTAIGMAFVVLRGRGAQRARIILLTPIVLIALFAGLSTFAPKELGAARERLLSLGDYGSDPSVRYRIAESTMVIDEIKGAPLIGSGFGATIYIGRPGTTVQAKPRRYAENGYLWLGWKLGLPGAALLLALLVLAVSRRDKGDDDPLSVAVRYGAQGGLVALIVASFSFPAFNSLTITPIIGLLVAICLAPPARPPAAAAQPPSGPAT